MRFLVGINTLNSIRQVVYTNHIHFFYRLAKQFQYDEFLFFSPPRMSIDRMRNVAGRAALEHNCDYLLFIDDDVLVPLEALKMLLAPNYDIMAGNVVIRGYPYNAMFFKGYPDGSLTYYNDWKQDVKENNVVDCAAVGFSCCLIKTELLKKVQPPYFVTGSFNTEDVYFCCKVKEAVPDVKIGVQTKVICGHVGDPRIFSPLNIDIHKQFDEAEDESCKDLVAEKKAKDRGDDYLKKCMAAFENGTQNS